ncbi:MAG: hypothetical protein QNJ48_06115 [Desulfobacterales bacterium]|nr:hypothetical protein [Desulfobacterales bacterium]MDJ0873697.1 hypothetical protein [Desulfobacterales bacterium]MDJ0883715.1 hypothetical protein [Desulfobacterales bacterium]
MRAIRRGRQRAIEKAASIDIRVALLLTCILASGLILGCQTTGSSREGLTVPQGNRIMIQRGGMHSGTFASRNMTINYSFETKGDKLLVSGTWDIRYRDIDRLSMTLFYLDADGTVIDYHPFFARPQRAVRGRVMDNRFNREFDLPADAKAFSIGYTGRTRLGGTEGKGRVFRHSPF